MPNTRSVAAAHTAIQSFVVLSLTGANWSVRISCVARNESSKTAICGIRPCLLAYAGCPLFARHAGAMAFFEHALVVEIPMGTRDRFLRRQHVAFVLLGIGFGEGQELILCRP